MPIISSLIYALTCGFSHLMIGLTSAFLWSNIIFFREDALLADFEGFDRTLATIGLVNLILGLSRIDTVTKTQGRVLLFTAFFGVIVNFYMSLENCDSEFYECWISKVTNFNEL